MVRNIQYVSIKRVLDNLLDHPLLQDVSLEQAIRMVLRFTALHGYPALFEDKLADVEIHGFRGELPCDLISIQQVRDKCTGICLRAMTKTFNPGLRDIPHKRPPKKEFPDLVNGYRRPPRYMEGMDRWHDHAHHFTDMEMSFKTQGRIIYTSFPEGVVEMAYKSVPVDDNGYPLLIDDENYLAALEAYIKVRVFTIKFDTGKISAAVLQNAQTEYAWLSAQLMDTFTIPSMSEMEAMTRMWNTLTDHRHEFEWQFQQLGAKEVRNIRDNAPAVVLGVTNINPEKDKTGDDPTIEDETLVWDDD